MCKILYCFKFYNTIKYIINQIQSKENVIEFSNTIVSFVRVYKIMENEVFI